MKTGAGLALIAVGAILAFAVTSTPSGFNINIAGWVLMIVGVIGLALPMRTYGWVGGRAAPVRQSGAGTAQTQRNHPNPLRRRRGGSFFRFAPSPTKGGWPASWTA